MNKVVFITGARRGLGLACAKKYAKEGYDVIINDYLEKEKLFNISKNIEDNYNVKCMVAFEIFQMNKKLYECLMK